MKPAPFAYEVPSTVEAVLALLAQHGDDAKVLAGGQSLVPMLNFRLLRPALLIDVNRVPGLDELQVRDGRLHIGARVRTGTLARVAVVRDGWPLLAEAAGFVGHAAIRARGTIGGSAAHADPQAELPAALAALDARFHLRSQRGTRILGADRFFTDFYTTALAPDELLTAIDVPPASPRTGSTFTEVTRTHGDFALAGAAVTLTLDGGGVCTWSGIGILGGGATPVRAYAAERALAGRTVDAEAAETAGEFAAAACDPPDPADYRRALIAELVRRAVLTARERVG
jgi:CO/xanthine dehydrogenase FAD-binding subunit